MATDIPYDDDYHLLQRKAVQALVSNSSDFPFQASHVARRQDYATDTALCLTCVTFPPATLASAICKNLITPLQCLDPQQYYYGRRSLHVTIKNVRSISDPPNFTSDEVRRACRVLSEVVPRFPPFDVYFEELHAFPNSIALVGFTGRVLGDLIHDLDLALRNAGIPDDKHYVSDTVFFATMTLCRFCTTPKRELLEGVGRISAGLRARMTISLVSLEMCNAVCHPSTRTTAGSFYLRV